jgi:hypothetical protein
VLIKLLGSILIKLVDADDDGRSAKFALLNEGGYAGDDVHVVIIPFWFVVYKQGYHEGSLALVVKRAA